MSTAVLAAGLSFGFSHKAKAEVCQGRTEIGSDNQLVCKRLGEGCNRICGFLEIK
jgi:hypothetical protein